MVGLGVLVLVGGVAAVLYCKSASAKDKGWKTVAVSRGPVVEKALAVGAIRPKHEIAVKSKISGIVKKSYKEVGDRVRAGELLFEIIPDPTPLELTEARREVEIAQNIYDQAKKGFDRSKALRDQGEAPYVPALMGGPVLTTPAEARRRGQQSSLSQRLPAPTLSVA